jgi:hypothetical protein
VSLFRGKASLLLFSDLFCRDFRQLFRATFTDKHCDFVIGWLATTFQSESLNSGVTLCAPDAVPFEQHIRDTTDLKSLILCFGITAWLDFVAQTAYLAGQRVSIDLSQDARRS